MFYFLKSMFFEHTIIVNRVQNLVLNSTDFQYTKLMTKLHFWVIYPVKDNNITDGCAPCDVVTTIKGELNIS